MEFRKISVLTNPATGNAERQFSVLKLFPTKLWNILAPNSLDKPRRFNLTGDMTNIYPFFQGSLEWWFSELFSANVSIWNQHKYIELCSIKIISFKILIITRISDEKTNELTRYGILCQNVTILYQQELASLFQVQKKLKASSKLNFSISYFIANNSHVKIVWLHVVVFSEPDLLHFWDNVHLFRCYPVKIPQNWN